MCGIAGIYRFDRQDVPPDDWPPWRRWPPSSTTADRTTAARPRSAACALASQRLSILDLSPLGHMPMRSDDGRLALVQNGEIYNYVEVRDELRALGHVFRSDGDTEVILRAYQQWGAACVERFVGMWAFAAVRHASSTPWSCRAIGWASSRCTCTARPNGSSSRPRSRPSSPTCATRGEPVRANPSSIATYMATGLVDGLEDTFFEGVTRFPAASNMHVRPDGVQHDELLGSARPRRRPAAPA